LFVARTAFVSGGRLYFCLFDDAMISMAYARNLVEGHGLNWARWGEPVEGFTHPLWLGVMILANTVPLALRLRSLLVQIVSSACLVGNVFAVHRLVGRHLSPGSRGSSWLAAAATASYYPLNFWALIGMETGLQALLATLAVGLALEIDAERDRHWLLFV